jgi:redox-sensitive bicupin YhaK (pirin superfamily)
LHFSRAGVSEFPLPKAFTSLAFTLEGNVNVGPEEQPVLPGQLAVLKPQDDGLVRIRGAEAARVLILSGEPIDEPVAAYGPFVMNTPEQISAAMRDYQSGKMGHLR